MTDIEKLIADFRQAKAAEDAAADKRKEIGIKIIALFADVAKPEGSVTKTFGNNKVTVTFSINRNVDGAQLQAAWNNLSAPVQAAFRWKPEVIVKDYKLLGDDDKKVASVYVESKPGSPQIGIKTT